MNSTLKSVIFYFIICICVIIPAENAHCDENEDRLVIATPEEAVIRADQYTGFLEKIPGKSIPDENVELITQVDTTTPFLSRFTDGKAVWKVRFENVLVLDNKEKNREGIRCDFDVYLDSISGHMLNIESSLKPFGPNEDPEMSALEAERQISGDGGNYSVTDKVPTSKFVDVIPFQFKEANKLVAQFVNYTERYNGLEPYWIVSLRGVPPEPAGGGSLEWMPIYMRNRIRNIIKDRTGRIKITSTIPHLKMKEEDKKRLFPDGFK